MCCFHRVVLVFLFSKWEIPFKIFIFSLGNDIFIVSCPDLYLQMHAGAILKHIISNYFWYKFDVFHKYHFNN